MHDTKDDDLMLQVRDGDVGPLGVLFARHQVPLYNFFLRLTGNRATSEDLVQEVFLRILKYRHTFRGDGQFGVWMYRIARNARADHYRKWGRETSDPDAGAGQASQAPSAHEALAEREAQALLHAALARLPEAKREILLLARFQKLRYEDIARILDCTVGTVKVRVHRAIKDLRATYLDLAKDQVS